MEDVFDGLSILTKFCECATKNIDISNPKILEKIINDYPLLKIYKKSHLNYEKENNANSNYNSLLFMNLLLADCQTYIAKNRTNVNDAYHFRGGAIGKISLRIIEITDENLALLRNGYGTSVISNIRLMLESYAIAKYLMESDDLESDKFQDFGIVQECQMADTDPKLKLQNKNYPDSFLYPKSDFTWISDKSINTPWDFINRLHNDEINKWYKYFCKYVHASPYSCGKIVQMNHSSVGNNNLYMPISFDNIIIQNKYYIMLFIELLADNFIVDEAFKELFKSVSQLIYTFKSTPKNS